MIKKPWLIKTAKLAWLVTVLTQPLMVGFAHGESVHSNPALRSPVGLQGPADLHELEDFLDRFLYQPLLEEGVPGAAVILVKDGQILFTKGYGYADLEGKISVDPGRTLFRLGSVSKLLTATAIMQLAERGKIDLSEDVNKYLKSFKVAAQYDRPIKVADLLTHTDGFDIQWYIGWCARSEEEIKPLGQYFAERMPEQIQTPGEAYLYSDVGMTLAGCLIEEITGVPLPQYIEENILEPLGMHSASFLQPLPAALQSNLAVGYEFSEDDYRPAPFLYFNSVPACALSSTVRDMARFMMAHLQNGRYDDSRILSEHSVKEMSRRHFTYHSRTPGVGYGFHVSERYPRTLYHGGVIPGYSARLWLLPDEQMGLFVAINSQDEQILKQFWERFVRHYYPAPPAASDYLEVTDTQQVSAQGSQLARFTGTYRYDHYPRHTFDRLSVLAGWNPHLRVELGNNNTLEVFPDGTKWVQVEPMVFKRVDEDAYLAFDEDDRGRITAMFTDDDVMRYERISWYETPLFHQWLLACFTTVFLTIPVMLGVSYLKRLLHNQRLRWADQQQKAFSAVSVAKSMLTMISILNLCLIGGLVAFVLHIDSFSLIWGLPRGLRILALFPPVSLLLTLVLIILYIWAWKDKRWTRLEQLYCSLAMTTAIAFIGFMYHWNLLGFRT